MAGIRIDLTPPETLSRFRDLAKAMLELADEVTPKLRAALEKKAQEMGVHPADFEIIAAELHIPKTFAQPQEPPPPSCEDAIFDASTDDELNNTVPPKSAVEQFNLAEKYHRGNGVNKDYAEAAKWYRMAAEHGHAKAQYRLGELYQSGEGVQKDYVEATKWFHMAAKQGYAAAQYFADKEIVGDYSWDQALAELRAELETSIDDDHQNTEPPTSAIEQFNLAEKYFNGRGVKRDATEAAKWYRMAAEQGYAEAQHILAEAYLLGNGVAKDIEEGVKWIRKEAEQGSSDAQAALGNIYYKGYYDGEAGVAKDIEEAAKWYRKAVASGNYPEKRIKLAIIALQKFFSFKNYLFLWLLVGSTLIVGGIAWQQANGTPRHFIELGDEQKARGDLKQAEENYLKGLQIIQLFAEKDPGNVDLQFDLAGNYQKMGSILKALGDRNQAEEYYLKWLKINQQLADNDPGNAKRQVDLAVCFQKVGCIQLERGDLKEAEKHFLKGINICQWFMEKDFGNPARWEELPFFYIYMGRLREKQGDLKQAEEYFMKGLKINQQLVANYPDYTRDTNTLFFICMGMGDIWKERGDLKQAEEYYLKSLDRIQRTIEKGPNFQFGLAGNYLKMGDVAKAGSKYAAAREWYEKELKISKLLFEKTGAASTPRVPSEVFRNLVECSTKLGDKKAVEAYELEYSKQKEAEKVQGKAPIAGKQ